MPHLKITNGQPETYSIGQLRRDNPNTSFPKVPSDALLADWGVYPYTVQDRPDYDRFTQTVVRTGIEQVEGVWVQGWVVEDLSVEDAGRNIRSHRDNLLQQTDWMALSDVTMSPAWASYRQALRDVTAQEGYPHAVIWPTKPE
jgi:hypothetical protein